MAGPETYSGNGHTATIADPENITREECLALAKCGADAWNKWRAEHPVRNAGRSSRANVADFSSHDLRTHAVDFRGFVFGEDADFSMCQFDFWARFEKSVLDSRTNFTGARFGSGLSFEGAQFGDFVRFDAIEVSGPAHFEAATLGDGCRFTDAIFSGPVSFKGAVLGFGAEFTGVCFLGELCCDGAIFCGAADFENAVFGDDVVMRATSFGGLDNFSCVAGYVVPASVDAALRRAGGAAVRKVSQRDTFKRVDLSGAIFQGPVDFSGRRFLGETGFGRMQKVCRFQRAHADGLHEVTIERRSTVFAQAPSFHECKLHQNTSFEGASFPVAKGSEAATRAYRTLKLAFAQQQATREEQRFFRLEMAEEALMAQSLRVWLVTWWQQRRQAQAQQVEMLPPRILYRLYAGLSDFGFGIARPLWLFVLALLLAMVAYGVQAGLDFCWPFGNHVCRMTGPLLQFGFAHALPGFEKLADPAEQVLFAQGLGVWTVLTLLLHKLVSVLALFLAGLGLRNLFKMK